MDSLKNIKKRTGNIMKSFFAKLFILMFLHSGLSIDRDFSKYLNSGRLDIARELLQSVSDKTARRYLEGLIAFYSGRYTEALEKLEEVNAPEEIVSAVRVSKKLFGNKTPYQSTHFLIFIDNEKDEILRHYIPLVVEEIYKEVGEIFNYYPESKIRIEIYSDRETFSKATTLKEHEVLRTGIVGVSKFNKLMLLTPRILVQGYNWKGTLRHEFIHYIVSAITFDQTPVWLQEAIARYFDGSGISIPHLYLLKKRIEEDRIISLEEMHPSIAKLPSDEDAALAFAEVYTLMDFFIKKFGKNLIMEILNRIENGEDALQVLRELTKMDLSSIMEEWKKHALSLAKNSFPAELPKLRFKDGNKKVEDKNYTLGNVLLERGYKKEAIFEYERSLKNSPYRRRALVKLVNLYIESGEYKKGEKKCKDILMIHPHDYTGNLLMGRIKLKTGKIQEAKQYFENALYINPFDIELHIYLYRVYEKLKDIRKEVEEEVIRKLKADSI